MQEEIKPTARNEGTENEKRWDLPRRQVMLSTLAVLLAVFVSGLNMTIVGVAMPDIIAELGGFSLYTWVTTAFMLTSTVMLPITGKISDMYGRKWLYVYGYVIFLVGSAFCALSPSINVLIAARAFQGLGAGIIMASGLIVFGDLFPPEDRGKYVGIFVAVSGAASAAGPLIGGWITDHLAWEWVFWISLPVGIPSLIFFILYFPKLPPAAPGQKLDYLGLTVMAAAIISLMLGLSWGGSEYPWGSAQVIGTLSFAAAMIGVLILVESRADDPFIPLSMFKNSIVNIGNFAGLITGLSLYVSILFIPLFFQGVLGKTATITGAFLIPMKIGQIIGGALGGQAVSRLGGGYHYRNVSLVGMVILAVGIFFLSEMTVNTSDTELFAYTALMGFGLGICVVLLIAVQNAVPHQIMGITASTGLFFRQLGGTLGLAVFGSLMTSRFASELTGNVSPEITEVLTPAGLSELADNPRALMGSEAQDQLEADYFSDLGSQGTDLFHQLMDTMKHALSTALTDLFLITLVLTILAIVVVLFMKKLPHRLQKD